MRGRAPAIAALLLACAPSGAPLTAPELPEMRAMVAVVQHGGVARAYAHALGGPNALAIDDRGGRSVTVLLYAEPLEALGLAEGPLRPAADGAPLPPHRAAFVLDLEGEDATWQRVERVPGVVSELRVVSARPRCRTPVVEEIELAAIPSPVSPRIEVTVLASDGPGSVIAATNESRIFRVTSSAATQLSVPEGGFQIAAGWLAPDRRRLWAAGLRLRLLDLDSGATVRDNPIGHADVITMLGPTSASEPLELWMGTTRRVVLRFDGAEVTELGRFADPGRYTEDLRFARGEPGETWVTARLPEVARIAGGRMDAARDPLPSDACGAGNVLDPEDGSRVTLPATWRGRPVLVRTCAGPEGSTMELLVREDDGRWSRRSAVPVGHDMTAWAPLLDGALFAGQDGRVVQLLGDGSLCPPLVPAPRHWLLAAAIDEHTIALSGPRVRADGFTPPAVTVLRFAP